MTNQHDVGDLPSALRVPVDDFCADMELARRSDNTIRAYRRDLTSLMTCVHDCGAVSYTHLTLPTTPYV